jgi:hypothetical protein
VGRSGLTLREAKGVRERLRAFYLEGHAPRAASVSALAERLRIPRPTISGWFGDHPKVPDAPHLVRMAERDRLSPAWLLVNKGPELLDAPMPTAMTGETLSQAIVAALGAPLDTTELLKECLPPAARVWEQTLAYWRERVGMVAWLRQMRQEFQDALETKGAEWADRGNREAGAALIAAYVQERERAGLPLAEILKGLDPREPGGMEWERAHPPRFPDPPNTALP